MVDVFISYSRNNRDRVRALADAVKALGYIVWWDDELPPHKSYGDVITEKITNAKAAIVCWSADAAQSEWVRAEADLARNQKKLIQTSYDEVMPPMPFNQIQFASLADWQGQADHSGWRKVQASLTDLCGAPGTAGPATSFVAAPPAAPPPPDLPPAPPGKSGISAMALVAIALVVLTVAAGVGWLMLGGDRQEVIAPAIAEGDTKAIQPPEIGDDSSGRYRLAAIIDDPDGYTNVRANPGTDAAIVARVNAGEAFTTYEQSGSFWAVRTVDGVTGYMARSRIRLLRDGVPIAATSAATNDRPSISPSPSPSPSPGDEWSDPSAQTDNRQGQIFADSDRRRLAEDDIAQLGPLQLRLARNEIYARKGRRFKNAVLRDHFSRFDWYRPTSDDVSLTTVEQANVDLLSAAERNR